MARNESRKKILIVALILIMSLLFAGAIKIYQIRHNSIWSEKAIKPLYQYGTVKMRQSYPGNYGEPGKELTRKDLVQLYFILATTREYNPEKDQHYIPDGWLIRDPYIVFYWNDAQEDAACRINWDYANNVLFVYDESGGNQTEAKHYYIDKKNSALLHRLYEKNILNLDKQVSF